MNRTHAFSSSIRALSWKITRYTRGWATDWIQKHKRNCCNKYCNIRIVDVGQRSVTVVDGWLTYWTRELQQHTYLLVIRGQLTEQQNAPGALASCLEESLPRNASSCGWLRVSFGMNMVWYVWCPMVWLWFKFGINVLELRSKTSQTNHTHVTDITKRVTYISSVCGAT